MVKSRWIPAAALLLPLFLLTAQAADLPRPAPDFTINTLDGKGLPLSQFKGHPLVVAFILTYCSHCQNAVGYLSKYQKQYEARGLRMVASAIEDNAVKALPMFVQNYQLPFPVGYNEGKAALAFMQHPAAKIPMMPMLAFIDKQGKIRAQFEGDDPFFGTAIDQNMHDQIEELLKVSAGGPVRKATPAAKKSTAK